LVKANVAPVVVGNLLEYLAGWRIPVERLTDLPGVFRQKV
jgi:hypothetical protein